MLPELPLYLSVAADILVFLFVGYYFLRLTKREKRVAYKEHRIDTNFHHIVDEALSQERQILSDATTEADQIITGAQYINHDAKEDIQQAVKRLVIDLHQEADAITKSFTKVYTASLQNVTSQSLTQFQTIMHSLQLDLKQQIKTFHESLLPEVEQELETYKQTRLKQIDQVVIGIVQKASEDILHKSLSPRDHEEIIVQSLEKAKNEGLFN